MSTRVLTQRQQDLVYRVIEEYIKTAEPVSSGSIAKSGHFDVQSATIRNEMADLEEFGFLQQLHKSGGRVPTARSYRPPMASTISGWYPWLRSRCLPSSPLYRSAIA